MTKAMIVLAAILSQSPPQPLNWAGDDGARVEELKKHGVASLEELRDACLEAGVKLIACQMTLDLFEFDKSEFIDGIEYGGAATFLEFAGKSDVTLFI